MADISLNNAGSAAIVALEKHRTNGGRHYFPTGTGGRQHRSRRQTSKGFRFWTSAVAELALRA